jgi:glycosyltransferase involved in cell wall biosynthesis
VENNHNDIILSVITPTYNAEKTVLNCIKSVEGQTWQNLEHLIVDGLSQDGTVELVRKELLSNDKVRLISEPDSGIYDAMNKGIKAAKGDWIFFLGSDDEFVHKNVIRDVFSDPEYNLYDVIYGDVESERFNGVRNGNVGKYELIYFNICHQGIFFRRSVFEKTGLFSLKYRYQSDWHHNLKWFYDSKIKKHYIKKTICHYADGGASSFGDLSFDEDKEKEALKLGWYVLTREEKWSLLDNCLKRSRRRNYPIVISNLLWASLKGALRIR